MCIYESDQRPNFSDIVPHIPAYDTIKPYLDDNEENKLNDLVKENE